MKIIPLKKTIPLVTLLLIMAASIHVLNIYAASDNNSHDDHSKCTHEQNSQPKVVLPKKTLLKHPVLLPSTRDLIMQPINKELHDHSSCNGHDHAKHNDKEEDHSGHDHAKADADAGCDGHDEDLIEITAEQKREIDLRLGTAQAGSLYKELTVPGEVVLNEDTVVHLVSRVPGIALQVKKNLGDRVLKNDIMAVLDSAELGEAKSEYYERFNDVGCCKIELDRAITIEKNTKKAIQDLQKLPTLAELKKNKYGDMGKYRSDLLASYSTFLTSKKDYERIKKLHSKKVVSESEYLQEQNDFDKAQADFFAKLHEAQFKIKQELADKKQQQRVSEFKLKTAERKLLILGLTKEQILKLQQTTSPLTTKTSCIDPVCKDCKTKAGAGNSSSNDDVGFSKYIITAPQDGTVTSKHITKGEKIDDAVEVFTIADLSKVWMNLKVAARDIPFVKEGMPVSITSGYGYAVVQGKIDLMAPTLDKETRTVIARVVVENPKRIWKPGMFVTGHIRLAGGRAGIALPTSAVQSIDGKNVVFVPSGHGYKPIPVVIGKRDRRVVQILSGLKAGDTYVDKGAFELKAIKVTSGQGAHAGHNH